MLARAFVTRVRGQCSRNMCVLSRVRLLSAVLTQTSRQLVVDRSRPSSQPACKPPSEEPAHHSLPHLQVHVYLFLCVCVGGGGVRNRAITLVRCSFFEAFVQLLNGVAKPTRIAALHYKACRLLFNCHLPRTALLIIHMAGGE